MWQNALGLPNITRHWWRNGRFPHRAKCSRYQHNGWDTKDKKKGKKGTGTLGKSSEGAEERGAGRAGQLLRQFDAHPRALVDDHDAVGVTQVHDLLSVRVVAGAE